MRPIARLLIRSDGRLFVEGLTNPFVGLWPTSEPRRASWIEPHSWLLRLVFRGLRRLFGDCGKVAEWTRTWRCQWRVDFRPLGESFVVGPFRMRSEAVEYEAKFVLDWLCAKEGEIC